MRIRQERAQQSDGSNRNVPLHPSKTYTRRQLLAAALAGGLGVAVPVGAGAMWAYDHPDEIANWYDGQTSLEPGSPYFPVHWTFADIHPSSVALVDFAGDEHASSNPKTWTELGMVATGRDNLARAKQATGGVQAVVYDAGDKIGIGYDPQGRDFFRRNPYDAAQVLVGMVVGNDDLRAAACVYEPDKGYVTLPEGGSLNAGTSGKLEIAAQYPGAFWV